jgi:hypothetical protein
VISEEAAIIDRRTSGQLSRASGDRFEGASFKTRNSSAALERGITDASGAEDPIRAKPCHHRGSIGMHLLIRTRSKLRSEPDAIPYTKEALERDLERVREAWDDSQADRRRDAIYGYLKTVYDLVSWWCAEKCEVYRACQALRLRGLLPWPREDVYAAMIRCTADPARADKRTRSKWSRVLRYVKMQKDEKEALAEFVKRKGGINECNARYGRCLGRLAASRRSIGVFQRRSASPSRRPAAGRLPP